MTKRLLRNGFRRDYYLVKLEENEQRPTNEELIIFCYGSKRPVNRGFIRKETKDGIFVETINNIWT